MGFLPLMGWNRISGEMNSCYFEKVMAPKFLVFLYFATIIGPATIMAAFYTHIYTVVLKQVRTYCIRFNSLVTLDSIVVHPTLY